MDTSKIFFRSSESGKIRTNGRGTVLTENQAKELKDFEARLREGGKLTDKQKETLKSHQAKRDAPFELSDTAKKAVEDVWLWNEKGFYKKTESKYLDKGLFGEEVGLSVLTKLDGRFYEKNTERIYKNNRTGECDNKFTLNGKKIIQDVKSSWDARTFMNAGLDDDYISQGQDYLDLYDADEFWLRYCLVDCPAHLVAKEKEREWYKYYSNTMSDSESQALEERMKPIFDQIDRNLVYSNSELYKPEEMVKTFVIKRDEAFQQIYIDRIPECLKYYKTIKLNGIS